MALFPLTSNFQEDFVLQLVAVDTENNMDEVAAAAAVHSVGRRVKARPGDVASSASTSKAFGSSDTGSPDRSRRRPSVSSTKSPNSITPWLLPSNPQAFQRFPAGSPSPASSHAGHAARA